MLQIMRILTVSGLVALPSVALAGAVVLESTFESSIEGWTVETRSSPASGLASPIVFTPDRIAAGGDPGAFLREVDPDGRWSFFRAPASWSGDRSALVGGTLRYSTRTDSDSFPDGRLVVLFSSTGAVISADLGVPDVNVWTRRAVDFDAGDWFVGTNGSGTLATEAEITTVLADLDILLIGMEFGADVAEEAVDLDSVSLSLPNACPADFNNDGTVDGADFGIFGAAFGSTAGDADYNPAADFNNDGTIDGADFGAFGAQFGRTDCLD
jgi:hypothetical protein